MPPSINRLIIAQVFRSLFFAGPIFTLFLLAKSLSLQQTLALISVVILSGMLFEIPTGVFADKYGRKWRKGSEKNFLIFEHLGKGDLKDITLENPPRLFEQHE